MGDDAAATMIASSPSFLIAQKANLESSIHALHSAAEEGDSVDSMAVLLHSHTARMSMPGDFRFRTPRCISRLSMRARTP